MMDFVFVNLNFIFGLIAGLWSFIQYLAARRRDLAWRRTEFIIQQSQYLDNDPEMRECTLILYGKHPSIKVDDFLRACDQAPDASSDGQIILKFEKYLNFLWRIAYAYLVLGTVTRKDLVAFGAYIRAVDQHPELREYCLGPYDEIVIAAKYLENADSGGFWTRLRLRSGGARVDHNLAE